MTRKKSGNFRFQRQHHGEYTSIADNIRLDRNFYEETPHFRYAPEPMYMEEDSETLSSERKS
ncbi:hypothetical protein OESDEN_23246 [Oesophagostomum dentatum]|uniref:Uncharacterized protein n=1 Tax=Oesophagostomum dentatum TaxID=61180 RepID=A0A0B1RWX0_OESDE|nr:hypothetical protein OESDEN_23246 [Oesophagostomum dentatum]